MINITTIIKGCVSGGTGVRTGVGLEILLTTFGVVGEVGGGVGGRV